ncbi:IS1 family transposase [Escherichia coli]|uniref:IS1 family transposase n=1 Tax=Escherichia coli TaxID=562 RepID=UPI00098CA7F2
MDQKLLTDFRSELLDSRFGAKAISTIAESKRFPLHEMRDDVAFQIINDELYLDGNARQNLATFCQTWDDENVHKLMDLSINKNWIDKEEYPQSAAIDLRCVNMVADLWHAPAPKNGQAVGTNTIGSSEACMLGGMAMKWRWRKRMEAAGKPTDKPNLVCGPVQICWHKFARYWDVELREIPMRPGQLFMDPKRMIEACDETFDVVIWMTDGWPLYESRLKGKLHVISKRYTQRIERHNLNLRQHLARLGRKSLSFSKSVELHDKVIGHYLNIKHYQ